MTDKEMIPALPEVSSRSSNCPLTSTEEAVAGFLFVSVLQCLGETPDMGKRRQVRKGNKRSHLHMAHGILKQNQVHHCVDIIVILQGFRQSLGQKFP